MNKIKSLSKLKKGILVACLTACFTFGFSHNAEAKFWGKVTECYDNEFSEVCCTDTYRFWIKWSTKCE